MDREDLEYVKKGELIYNGDTPKSRDTNLLEENVKVGEEIPYKQAKNFYNRGYIDLVIRNSDGESIVIPSWHSKETQREISRNVVKDRKTGKDSLKIVGDKIDLQDFDNLVAEVKNELGNDIKFYTQSPESNKTYYNEIEDDTTERETGKAYKLFEVVNGKLYPPMVKNPGNNDTPIGKWIRCGVDEFIEVSSGWGKPQVSGKNLAFRAGWHLGELPYAPQFESKSNPGYMSDKYFIWGECDYDATVDYQDIAMSYGFTKDGKFTHSAAGLPYRPINGYYKYRTNPNPETIAWVITGSMKVNRLLDDSEVERICRENNVPYLKRPGGEKTVEEVMESSYRKRKLKESINKDKLVNKDTIKDIEIGDVLYDSANTWTVVDKYETGNKRTTIRHFQMKDEYGRNIYGVHGTELYGMRIKSKEELTEKLISTIDDYIKGNLDKEDILYDYDDVDTFKFYNNEEFKLAEEIICQTVGKNYIKNNNNLEITIYQEQINEAYLNEGRSKEYLMNTYKLTEPEVIKYQELDPSRNKDYTEWIIRLDKNKQLEKGHIRDLLTRFEEVKKDLKNKDIGRFKSMQELDDYMNNEDNYNQLSDSQKQGRLKRKIHSTNLVDDAELVYEDNDWEVYVPKTYEASCKLGSGTSWCTASNSDDYYYNMYKNRYGGNYYININKHNPEEKYQFHFESNQFMDKYDYSINLLEFLQKNKGLYTFYKDAINQLLLKSGLTINEDSMSFSMPLSAFNSAVADNLTDSYFFANYIKGKDTFDYRLDIDYLSDMNIIDDATYYFLRDKSEEYADLITNLLDRMSGIYNSDVDSYWSYMIDYNLYEDDNGFKYHDATVDIRDNTVIIKFPLDSLKLQDIADVERGEIIEMLLDNVSTIRHPYDGWDGDADPDTDYMKEEADEILSDYYDEIQKYYKEEYSDEEDEEYD